MEKPQKKTSKSKDLLRLKEDIRKKLTNNEYYLAEIKNPSKAWQYFRLIMESGTKTSIGFVQCIKCHAIHKHNSTITGTSHLNKHLEACVNRTTADTASTSVSEGSKGSGGTPKSSLMTNYFNRSTPVSKKMKKEMLQGAIAFCSLDMRPFEAVKGQGLEFMTATAMRLAVKYGLMSPKDILPNPTTVSRNIKKVVQRIRGRLVPYFQSLMQRGICSATTDMWTDDYRKTSYTTVTLQYVDSDWNIIRKVLFTCAYPDDKKKTADNIRDELCSKFISLGFDIDVIQDNVVFVTDQGPNIVKALEPPFQRVDCCAHVLNTVLRNLFNPKALLQTLPEVQDTFVAAKALVAFLKHSGLSSRLKTAVHQEVETRWNSRLAMLKSVSENYSDIQNILSQRKDQEIEKLHAINLPIIKTLIKFLEPFKASSDSLEADGCTINLVLSEYMILLNFLTTFPVVRNEPETLNLDSAESSEDDMDVTTTQSQSSILESLKVTCRAILLSKFIITDTHKLALLLTPVAKDVGLREHPDYTSMTLDEREKIIKQLRDLVAAESSEDLEASISQQPISDKESDIEETLNVIAPSQPEKKMKFTLDRLKHFVRKSTFDDAPQKLMIDEVSTYFKSKYNTTDEMDALQWWRKNRETYPVLSNIARRIFSIPATSASSERVFSSAGYVVNERRSRLSSESVDAILYLNSNADVNDFIVDESTDEED